MRTTRLGSISLLALVLLAPACTSGESCTDADCQHSAVVTFPVGIVSGSYLLILADGPQMAMARCLDPGNPETADNPEGLRCDAQGFTLEGHELANARELTVTIIPDEGDEVVEAVRLEAVDEITPNGPDCPPICFVRNGQLRLGVGG